MESELKPVNCGCGGEAKVDTKLVSCTPVERKRVYCSECYISTEWMKSEAEAITSWNRAMGAKDINVPNKTAKVQTVEKPNVFKCSECGQYFHSTAWGSPVEYCSRCGARLIWGEDDE